MKIKNYKLKIVKRGFTLIEMLVAVVVFMIVFLIAASFVNLAAGSTKSNRTKMLTGELRSALDTIMQQLNGANDKENIGGLGIVYGFRLHPGGKNILGIVHYIDSTHKQCTFIGQKGNSIAMKINDCIGGWPDNSDLDQPLTGSNVLLAPNSITFSGTTNWNKNDTASPYLQIIITAKDTDPKYQDDNQITVQTSYTMDYETIYRLKKLP